MKKIFFILLVFAFFSKAYTQTNPVHGFVEAQGIYTSNGQVPFWMRSDQFGSIPLSGASGSLIASVGKQYDSSRKKLFDWEFGLEGRANVGNTSQFILVEADAKLRLGVVELKGGRSKD